MLTLCLAESISLNLDDVDLDRGEASALGKGNKHRLLPLTPGVIAAVRDYLALRRTQLLGPDHGALFVGRDGKRLRQTAFRQWL